MISSGILCGICTLFLVLGSIANAESTVPPSSICKGCDLLKNPFFVDPARNFNTDTIYLKKVNLALENWSWGVRGYSWSNETMKQFPIEECEFTSYENEEGNHDVMLYAKDGSGNFAVASLIQGWVWTEPKPASWYSFAPLPVKGNKMIIKTWVCYQGGLFPKIHCCPIRNGIIDIWMIDESSGKKLMMDLFFFGQGTRWKENDIYHYAAQVADVKEDVWTEVDVDLDYNIDQAIRAAAEGGMNFQKEHLKIYQVEILEELRYAWGKLLIGSFELTY